MRKRTGTGIVTTVEEGKKSRGGKSRGEKKGAEEEQINSAAVGGAKFTPSLPKNVSFIPVNQANQLLTLTDFFLHKKKN